MVQERRGRYERRDRVGQAVGGNAVSQRATTDGALLGGRVAYRQYRDFYRSGLEPVLLAASVPALAGERVLEAGCGAGAGLACLGVRIPGLSGTGIEQDPEMAALARYNLAANRLDWPVLALPVAALRDAAALDGTGFDHAFANPPWHRADGSRSPDPRRDLARRAPAGMLNDWAGSLATCLRPHGTLTLALPASLHAQGCAALLEHGFGGIRLMPFWPKPGRAARIILLRGTRGGLGDSVVLPGLTLHEEGGGFTEEAEAILRGAAPLPLG